MIFFDDEYENLKEYTNSRRSELSDMFHPYVKVTDEYGKLVCYICVKLGEVKPCSLQDKVIRDLMSDVFDFLYESREIIIFAKLNIAYPLARRAYESLSLLALCANNQKYAQKWESGKQIGNHEIRKELSKQTFGENEQDIRELYKFFSQASHPNRELVSQRFLGEGNQFVLGSIGMPDILMTTDYCLKHLSLWFWFGAILSFFYSYKIPILGREFGKEYLNIANEAKKVSEWLVQNYNHLINGRDNK